MQLQNLEKYS